MITNPNAARNSEQLSGEKKVLFCKTYHKDCFELSLRWLDLSSDWPVVFNWINQYAERSYLLKKNQQEIRKIFTSMTYSDYVFSYLCQLNKKPIAQVDLFRYAYNDMFPEFQCQQGDHGMKLLASPGLSNQKRPLIPVIEFCLEYLFSNKKINRIIFETDLENVELNESLVETGFRFAHTAQLEFYKVNIYTCSRSNYESKLTGIKA